MISSLLHQRLLGAGASDGIVSPPDWAGDLYPNFQYSEVAPTTGFFEFTLRTDGTWQIVDEDGIQPAGGSGNWRLPGGAGAGTGFAVRFTPTSAGGVGDITNGAAAFQALNANRSIKIAKTQLVPGSVTITYDVLVEIQKVATGLVVASGTFRAQVTVEVRSTGGGGGGGGDGGGIPP